MTNFGDQIKNKILIVDDEPDVIEMLSYNFKINGFEVFSENHDLSAYLNLDHTNPDMIILDVMMPYMEGILI